MLCGYVSIINGNVLSLMMKYQSKDAIKIMIINKNNHTDRIILHIQVTFFFILFL